MTSPHGWVEVPFGELFDFKGGAQPPKASFKDTPSPGYVRLLQIRDFESDKKAVYIKDDQRWHRCNAKDIMIGRYGASVGKILSGKQGAYNVALVRMLFDESKLDRDWVRRFLESEHFQEPLKSISRSAQNGFNKADLEDLLVPLPPLAEQRRIVVKLEALNARLARARLELEKITILSKGLRSCFLKFIFSDFNEFKSVRELSQFITSGSRGWAKYYSDSGAAFIRVGDVRREDVRLDMSSLQRVQPPVDAEGIRTALRPNDIVVTITADLGRVGVVPDDLGPAYVNQHVALVRLQDTANSKWVAWYLCSEQGQAQLLAKDRGVTKAGLGLDDIRNVAIPVVDSTRRDKLVAEISVAFARADRIEAEVAKAKKLLDRLESAILANAFKGELVPQDPNDEPASVLLARIRAQREAAAKVPGGRDGRRKAG